jgi:hypothetical protein
VTDKVFCSVIIPTIGRSTLERAAQSVLSQGLSRAAFEVIIANDSGAPLPAAPWHALANVRIIDTNRRERSFARNSGAAVARGSYLAFLDDDDWLLPGALDAFYDLASRNPEAVWLYGGIRVVTEAGETLAEINTGLSGNCFAQIVGGAWAPIQSSLMRADAFFRVGGFSPFICGTEDEDLCRRLAYTGDFANAPATVACLFRGPSWTTSTNYLRAPQDTKISRDAVLAEPGALSRLAASAGSPYWHGRVCRVYLSTIGFNARRRRLFAALSRSFSGIRAFLLAGRRTFQREFWAGMKAHHVPDTLHFVIEEYERRETAGGAWTGPVGEARVTYEQTR